MYLFSRFPSPLQASDPKLGKVEVVAEISSINDSVTFEPLVCFE
jgi:hypothetical protein